VRWLRVTGVLRTAIGDDGTGAVWPRLTPDGEQVMRLAFAEARELDMPCIGDEHVLVGLLRHGNSGAAAMLAAHGLDLAAAHAGLRRLDPRRERAPALLLRCGRWASTPRRYGSAWRQPSARLRCKQPSGGSGAGAGGAAATPAPTRCASTCWPNAPCSSPTGSLPAAATPVSGHSTCSTGCCKMPATRSAHS